MIAELEPLIKHRIQASSDQIAEFCDRWKIIEFALFGSVLRDDFRPDSDIDVLVTFSPEQQLTWDDCLTMQEEIETLFKRKVDLVIPSLLEVAQNKWGAGAVPLRGGEAPTPSRSMQVHRKLV